jgi:hypothetical protein
MTGNFSNSAVHPTLDKGVLVECGSLTHIFGVSAIAAIAVDEVLGRDVDLNIAAVVGKQ